MHSILPSTIWTSDAFGWRLFWKSHLSIAKQVESAILLRSSSSSQRTQLLKLKLKRGSLMIAASSVRHCAALFRLPDICWTQDIVQGSHSYRGLSPLLHFGHAGTEKKGQALHGASNPTASPHVWRLAPKDLPYPTAWPRPQNQKGTAESPEVSLY